MTNPLHDYGSNLPDDVILGQIVWFTITQPKVTHEELKQWVTDAGLSTKVVPPKPRVADAFKRACRYSERLGLPIPGSNAKANFLIRKVAQTATDVERHIVLEEVDANQRKLDYGDVAHMKFDRNSEMLNVKKRDLPDPLDAMLLETIRLFTDCFDESTKYIDAQQLRRFIRDELDLLNGIGLRAARGSGSIYFVPQRHREKIEGLDQVVNKLGNGSVFHALPLIDSEKQREMVQHAFEEEIHDESIQLIQEIREMRQKALNGTKVTPKAWERYKERLDILRERSDEYSKLVSDEVNQANIELDLLDEEVMGLLFKGLVK